MVRVLLNLVRVRGLGMLSSLRLLPSGGGSRGGKASSSMAGSSVSLVEFRQGWGDVDPVDCRWDCRVFAVFRKAGRGKAKSSFPAGGPVIPSWVYAFP